MSDVAKPPRTSDAVRSLISGRRHQLILLGLTSFLGGLAEAAFLVLVTRLALAIADERSTLELFGGTDLTITGALAVSFALSTGRVGLAAAGSWQAARLMSESVAQQRKSLASAYLEASWTAQDRENSGQFQELLTSFTQRGNDLINGLTLVISSGCSLTALLVLAVTVDPAGALVVIASGACIGAVLRPLRASIRRRSRRLAKSSMDFASALSETAQLGLEMHVFNVQRQTRERVWAHVDEVAEADRRLMFVRTVLPQVYTGVAYMALVIALSAVARLDSTNLESLGAIMLMMLRSLSYGQQIQSSSASVSSNAPFLQALQDRIRHFRNQRLPSDGAPVGEVGTIDLDQVSFSYEPGRPVLRGLTATISPQQVVGIVGPSGSGKSTLVQLLLGLRSPDSGRILVDGRSIIGLSRSEWARKVTFVPQASRIISGTVEDNIRFYREGVTLEEVQRAARLAHLDAEIRSHPDGYARRLGDGSSLSGGQQQRLCIARALVERPDVLILDEPTSALDATSESAVRATLSALKDQMTIFIVAHRLSTLQICDRIMVIQDGLLDAYDTPQNLALSSKYFEESIATTGSART